METELILCTGADAPGFCMCAFTLYCFYCLSTQTLRNFVEVTDSESLREIINVPPLQWQKQTNSYGRVWKKDAGKPGGICEVFWWMEWVSLLQQMCIWATVKLNHFIVNAFSSSMELILLPRIIIFYIFLNIFYILLPVNLFFFFRNEHFWAPSKGWTIPYFYYFYFVNLLFTNSKVVGFKTKLCTFKCISAMQQCYSFSMKISLYSTDSELLNSFSMNISVCFSHCNNEIVWKFQAM